MSILNTNTSTRYTLNIILSALLCALPFTFPWLFPLAWVGLVPFFGKLLTPEFFEKEKKTAFFAGFKWGFFYCAFIYYWFVWLYPMEFAGFTPLGAAAVVGAAWLGISAFQALAFGMGTLVFRVIGKNSPVILAIIFTLCEFSWHFGTLSLPWCEISITQYKFLPAIQSASLFGSLFVSFLIYVVNAFLSCGIKNKKLLIGIAVLCVNILYGTIMLNIPQNYTNTADFALIQGNISSAQKWEKGSAQKCFDMFYDLSHEAQENNKNDYVVWPESAVPVSFYSSFHDEFLSLPHKLDATVLMGSLGWQEGKNTNSLFMIEKDGVNHTVYNKRHLVPFGEYLPFSGFFERFFPLVADINMLSDDLYEGKDSMIMETGHGNIGSLICFDSIFPSLSRQSTLDGAQMLILITNDSWYFDSSATSQHAAQAVFRAVENRRCVARCANTGISMLIDQNGRIKEKLGALEKGYVSGTLGFLNTYTLYTRLGNIPLYGAALYILILLIIKALKSKKEKHHNEETL